MSTSTYFKCDACHSYVWVGQNDRIYGYKGIPEWLHEHIGCDINFVTEHDIEDEDYDSLIEWTYDDVLVDSAKWQDRALKAEARLKEVA
jgi:hypothetical protein